MTVSDGDGGSDSDSVAVTVTNVAPTIAISGAANVNEGSLYTLTLGTVTDPGTTPSLTTSSTGATAPRHYARPPARRRTPTPTAPTTTTITVDLVDEDGTYLSRANAKR